MRATPESLGQTLDAAAHLTGALDILESTLQLVRVRRRPRRRLRRDRTSDDDASDADPTTRARTSQALARRAGELRDELRFLLRAGDDDYVYFVEFRGRGIFLRASPIDVSAIVRELLLDRMRTTVLTSATLTVDGAFDYIRTRLGIGDADEVRLPSEFDFSRQAILYLPQRMPDPRADNFAVAAGREVIEILKRTRGRAFVLFTSYATMRAVQAMAEMALDYPILAQGSAPRSQLLNQFRETPHAVLFATSSFWQGVDVVGEALSCVIVDKLPFASPGDPITAARIDAIRARGGDPFGEYQVPLAILALQQGLGRLIRHRRDRGVLAVLDPRLRTKGYGRRFIASLPPAPVVHDLAASTRFFLRGPIRRLTGSGSHSRRFWKMIADQGKLAACTRVALILQEDSMVRRLNGRLPWLVACVRRARGAGAGAAGRRPVHRDGPGRREGRRGQAGRRRESHHRHGRRQQPPLRNQVEQERRVHPDRPGSRGPYKVTAEKDKLVSNAADAGQRQNLGPAAAITLVLGAGGGGVVARGRRRRTPS